MSITICYCLGNFLNIGQTMDLLLQNMKQLTFRNNLCIYIIFDRNSFKSICSLWLFLYTNFTTYYCMVQISLIIYFLNLFWFTKENIRNNSIYNCDNYDESGRERHCYGEGEGVNQISWDILIDRWLCDLNPVWVLTLLPLHTYRCCRHHTITSNNGFSFHLVFLIGFWCLFHF